MKKRKNEIDINLGGGFWLGISFTAGCFGFGWLPFLVVVCIFLIIGEKDGGGE